jgi:hypothetical protein
MAGKMLSGSEPPVEFFRPFALLFLTALYGSGAILIRELRVRWDKGWPTVFALGAAYGIVEEGLMVKSFFDPNWIDLGPLGSYGRWAGVNWVWSLQLTIFHALSFLLLADVLLGFFLLTLYRPPLVPYVLAVVAVIVLFLVARRLPAGDHGSGDHEGTGDHKGSPLRFALVGFGATVAFFVILWVPPEIGVPVPLTLLAAVALVVLVVWIVQRMSHGGAWTDERRLALGGGALGFFVLLALVQELDNLNRPDDTTGMTLVGLVTLVFLVWLWRRVVRRNKEMKRCATITKQPGW